MRLKSNGRELVEGVDYVLDPIRGLVTFLTVPPRHGRALQIVAEYPAATRRRKTCSARGGRRGGRWWDRRATNGRR